MRKKLLVLLLAVISAICLTSGLAACASDRPKAHRHELQHVEAVEATCEADGNREYWYCPECGMYFTDAGGTVSTTAEAVIIEALGHSFTNYVSNGDATCTQDGTKTAVCDHGCGRTDTIADAGSATGHTYSETWSYSPTYHWHAATCGHTDEVSDRAAHTMINGTCTVCGYTDHLHELQHVEAVEATCEADGNREYWYCPECGMYYTNAEGTVSTTAEAVIIEALGHSFTNYVSNGDATCTQDGTKTAVCDHGCGRTDTIADAGSATGHTYSETWSYSPTHHWHAATCGHTDEVSDRAAHTMLNGACTVCGYSGGTAGLTYTLSSDGTYYLVSGLGTATASDIVIPSYYNELPVTGIANRAFYGETQIKSIRISPSITYIGSDAFNGCSEIAAVYISDLAAWCTTEFNGYFGQPLAYGAALYLNDTLLTDLSVPDSITEISAYAFYDCSSITGVTVPDSIETIGDYAFRGCNNIVSASVGDGVTSIGTYVFAYCSSLEEITLGDNTDEIGIYAFYHCTALESITLPDGVKTIGYDAFDGCTLLSEVYLGKSLTDIGMYAFRNTALTEITLPSTLQTIGDYAFRSAPLTGIVIPSSVTAIGEYAFYRCTYLESLTIQNAACHIGLAAFSGCSALSSVNLGNSVTAIGDEAFYNCESLSAITLPSTLQTIGDLAFYSTALSSISIPDSVTSIGNTTFYGCANLSTVSIGTGVQTIGNYAFQNCSKLTRVTVPSNVTSLGMGAFYGCTGLISATVENGTIGQYAFRNCTNLTGIHFGSGVTKIDSRVFQGCTSLSGVYITDLAAYCAITSNSQYGPMEMAGNLYLNGSLLTELVIPDGVTTIGRYAFKGCTSITSLTIPAGVTTLGAGAFMDCASLTEINYNATLCSNAESYVFSGVGKDAGGITLTIGANVTRIPDSLFSSSGSTSFTNITEVIFEEGSSCTEIGSSAFASCTKIEAVYVTELADWCNINFTNSSANPMQYAEQLYINGEPASGRLTIGEGITAIPAYTFKNSTALTAVTIAEGVTSIGDYAFSGCTSLTCVVIPAGMTSIGDNAFSECTKLFEVYNLSDLEITAGSSQYGGVAYYAIGVYTSLDEPGKLSVAENGLILYIDDEAAEYYVMAYEGNDAEVILPEDIEGHEYKIYPRAFYGNKNITSITIGEGVAEIGEYAFYECTALTEIIFNAVSCEDLANNNYVFAYAGRDSGGITVTIGAGVTRIPAYLFYPYYTTNYAPAVTHVEFAEESVCTSIGGYAFAYNVSLTDVAFPSSLTECEANAFQYCEALEGVYITSLSAWCNIDFGNTTANPLCYAGSLYVNGEQVTQLVIPDGVTAIKDYAFYGCTTLESAVIPDGVETIGNSAFRDCASLKSVTLGADVTTVGEYAFCGCPLIRTLTIPAKMTAIGNSAFSGCYIVEIYNLSSLEITPGSSDNGYVAYYAADVYTSADAESKLFENSDGFVMYIDDDEEVYSLVGYEGASAEITLPEDISGHEYDIRRAAFYGNTLLKSVTVPGSVTAIGNIAFANCTSLESIILPETLTELGGGAFNGCISLESITLPGGLTEISSSVFANCTSLKSIAIPDGVSAIGSSAFSGCSSLAGITLPAGLTVIEAYTFNNCAALNSVIIPSAVTAIGERAFYNCASLESITMQGSVSSIGSYAFYGCSSLAGITLPYGLTVIEAYTFYNCTTLNNVIIPSTVTAIGDGAFYNCSLLESIAIPGNVSSIGRSAFYGCESLFSVEFANTSGWWRSTNPTAESGTEIASSSLANSFTAATYLSSTYFNYYWKRG